MAINWSQYTRLMVDYIKLKNSKTSTDFARYISNSYYSHVLMGSSQILGTSIYHGDVQIIFNLLDRIFNNVSHSGKYIPRNISNTMLVGGFSTAFTKFWKTAIVYSKILSPPVISVISSTVTNPSKLILSPSAFSSNLLVFVTQLILAMQIQLKTISGKHSVIISTPSGPIPSIIEWVGIL